MKLYLKRTEFIAYMRERLEASSKAGKGEVRLALRYCKAVIALLENPELDEVQVETYERRLKGEKR